MFTSRLRRVGVDRELARASVDLDDVPGRGLPAVGARRAKAPADRAEALSVECDRGRAASHPELHGNAGGPVDAELADAAPDPDEHAPVGLAQPQRRLAAAAVDLQRSELDAGEVAGQLDTPPRTSLPPAQFPNTVALVDKLMSGGPDERFEFGLDVLVRGLAAQREADADD